MAIDIIFHSVRDSFDFFGGMRKDDVILQRNSLKPNKTLQLTPSRLASTFHDRLSSLSTLTQEFSV
jgi:hypothetical protein